MPFRPNSDRHAIQEVSFVLTFARPFNSEEVARVVEGHDRWRAELPGIKRGTFITVDMTGRGPTPVPAQQAGVSFDAHKRDGSIDWRLRVEDNWMAVNCRSYTSWQEVWPRARRLLAEACELGVDDNQLIGLALQYIDRFDWEGNIDAYDAAQLLRKNSEYLPASIWGRGPLWHLYQGWFIVENLPVSGRLLERTHVDAAINRDIAFVKFDSTLRLDLQESVGDLRLLFAGDQALVDRVMEDLHIRNKRMMGQFLTQDMAERIALNAGS